MLAQPVADLGDGAVELTLAGGNELAELLVGGLRLAINAIARVGWRGAERRDGCGGGGGDGRGGLLLLRAARYLDGLLLALHVEAGIVSDAGSIGGA